MKLFLPNFRFDCSLGYRVKWLGIAANVGLNSFASITRLPSFDSFEFQLVGSKPELEQIVCHPLEI